MDRNTYQKYLQDTIDKGLYIEDAVSKNGVHYDDIDRIMYTYQGRDFYVCAFPKRGVKEEFDRSYVSDGGQPFPNRENLDSKVKAFVDQLPADIDLYD